MNIQSNIPIPSPDRGRKRKYPFPDMAIGDSFFLPNCNTARMRSTVHNSATSFAKKTGKKFTTRTTVEDSVPGLRIWRIS